MVVIFTESIGVKIVRLSSGRYREVIKQKFSIHPETSIGTLELTDSKKHLSTS